MAIFNSYFDITRGYSIWHRGSEGPKDQGSSSPPWTPRSRPNPIQKVEELPRWRDSDRLAINMVKTRPSTDIGRSGLYKPSGKHRKSYLKWWFIVDLPIEHGGSFHSFFFVVNVYQRVTCEKTIQWLSGTQFWPVHSQMLGLNPHGPMFIQRAVIRHSRQ